MPCSSPLSIAAGFFAVGVCAAVFVLVRLGRLISLAGGMLADYRDRTDVLIDRAQAAVDRSHEQLARTDAITASMDEVSSNMAELSGQVSALAGLARGISAGLGTPLTRLAALAYGIRRAVGAAPDRGGRAAEPGPRWPGASRSCPASARRWPAGGSGCSGDPQALLDDGRRGGRRGRLPAGQPAGAGHPAPGARPEPARRPPRLWQPGHFPGRRAGRHGTYVNRRAAPPGPTLEGQHVLADGRGQPAASRAYPGTNYAKDGR